MTPQERAEKLMAGVHSVNVKYEWTGPLSLAPSCTFIAAFGFELLLKEAIAKAIEEAVKDRDMEWRQACALVDNVAPTPEAVKEWLMAESEYLVVEAVDRERERCVNIVRANNCDHPANISSIVEAIRSGGPG